MYSLPVRLDSLVYKNLISLLLCDIQPMLDTEDGRGKRTSRIVDPVCVFWNFSLSTEEYVYKCSMCYG